MSKKYNNSAEIGKTKKSTDNMIDDAIARQNSWMARRSAFAKRFLKKMNVFARPAAKPIVGTPAVKKEAPAKKTGLAAYWFPIMCALLVIFVAIWVMFVRVTAQPRVVVIPAVPEPTVSVVNEKVTPSFDIVRIEKKGNVVIAGRWLPSQSVSIVVNKKVVATERTNTRGEFVYAPKRVWQPGNYTISLITADSGIKSENSVFVYISEHGYKNSVSLLMKKDGSTLMQKPELVDGDLVVSKIDYLDTGRIVITGNALPRLRVSLTLNGTYLGFARVSDHKAFGFGADVTEKLESGKHYYIAVRLHDGDGKIVAKITHHFVMPEPTGDDDTYYTVRRGDCLWIIARNFLRTGTLFSIIATRNDIANPDLIYPKQILQIPTKVK